MCCFRRKSTKLLHALVLSNVLLIIASGCAARVTKLKPIGDIGRLAILPVEIEPTVPRERVQYLASALGKELLGTGFLIFEPSLIASICSSTICPEKEGISQRYGVNTFAQLKVTSLSKNNFLAGYYNTIRGTLSLIDASGQELYRVEDSKSERGGLLFHSGQVLKGLESTVENFGDDQFQAVIDEFLRGMVSSLPKPKFNQNDEQLLLSGINVSHREGTFYNFCLSGTRGGTAKLRLGKQQVPLREVERGRYCSILPLGLLAGDNLLNEVELRSAFGQSIVEPLQISAPGICEPEKAFRLETGRLVCEEACNSEACHNSTIVLFSAPSREGPFTKMKEVTPSHFPMRIKSPNVAVIALSKDGSASLPKVFESRER